MDDLFVHKTSHIDQLVALQHMFLSDRIGTRPPWIGTRGWYLTPNNGKNAYFCSVSDPFGPFRANPRPTPHQSQNKSLSPRISRCSDRIGPRHIIKRNTHQDQIVAFFGSFFWLKFLFFNRPDRIRTGSYSIGTFFWNFDPSKLKTTICNIPKCILNYYTCVKMGSYSIGTLCTGSYSIGILFLAKIWRVPILSGHPVYVCIFALFTHAQTLRANIEGISEPL